MSLINEALKKAQRQRQAAATTPPAAEAPPAEPRPIVRRRPPVSANKVVTTVGLIVLGFALVAGAAFYFFIPRGPELERVTHPARPPATPPATPPAPPGDEPAVEPAPAPAVVAPAPSNSPTVSFPAAGPPPAAVAPTPAPPVTPAPAPAPAERNPRIIAYVEALRVAGIRPSDTDPRVLMNDRVFRLNDIVDRNLGLRLTAVKAQRLVFTDEAGLDYEKRF